MESNTSLNATQTWAAAPGQSETTWMAGLLLISLAVHVVAVVSIGKGHAGPQSKRKPPTLVTLTVERAKPAPPAAAHSGSGAPQRMAPKRAAVRPTRAAVTAPPPAAAPPAAETPADFTGVTLTNDGPRAGWASATGNRGAMNGPIGTPGARVTGRSRSGTAGAAGPGPRSDGAAIVELADLSKPPRAPVLSDMLERNYPDEARRRGVPGKAVMHVRVMPDGHLRDLIVVAASEGGFGEACRRTLRDSLWSPPLDRESRPVSTFVSYTCTFDVH
jgi:outer membrane biosynthesis protein TonB